MIKYTIRGISPELDAVLRKRAKATGKTLNQTVLEALERGVTLLY